MIQDNAKLLWTIVLVILLLGYLNSKSYAWSFHTHRKIVSDALKLMPQGFINRFGKFKEEILQGSTDPDINFKDFQYHSYHIHGNPPLQLAVEKFRDLFISIPDKIKRGAPDAEIARWLGIFAHYISDINQPLHTDGYEIDPREDEYHQRYEKDVEQRLSKITIGTFSYEPVSQPIVRLDDMAREANRYYSAIGAAYRSGKQIFDLIDITNAQYQRSVKNVIDYWLGICREAGISFGETAPPVQVFNDLGKIQKLESIGTVSILKPTAVNINTASLEELMNIPGIGKKRAQEIIKARPFKGIYDLIRIKGFNPKLIERISDYITVGQ